MWNLTFSKDFVLEIDVVIWNCKSRQYIRCAKNVSSEIWFSLYNNSRNVFVLMKNIPVSSKEKNWKEKNLFVRL